MLRHDWLLISIIVFVVYANTLPNSWHFDDYHSIVDNQYIRSLRQLPRYFVSPESFSTRYGADSSSSFRWRLMYRPLLLVGYALTYAIAGLSLPFWHGVQIGLHLLMVLLVRRLFKECGAGDELSFFAALLYGVHPINSQAVNYLSSRSEIQASICMLGSLLAAIRASNDEKLHWHVLALAFFAAALLTKAIAVTTPVLFFLWLRWWSPQQDEPWRRTARRLLPFAVVVCSYFFLRWCVIGTAVVPLASTAQPLGFRLVGDHVDRVARHTMAGRSVLTNLAVQATALFYYAYVACWPPAQSIVHHLSLPESLLAWPAIVTVPLVLLFVGLAFWFRRSHPLPSFALLFSLVCLAPTSLIPLNLVVNEHRIYLAIAPWLLMLSGLIWRFSPCRRVCMCALIAVLALVTVSRNRVWRSELSLWSDAHRKAAGNFFVHRRYGRSLYGAGRRAEALWQWEIANRLRPVSEPAFWRLMAATHLAEGNLHLARHYAMATLRVEGDDPETLLLWAYVLRMGRRPDGAVKQLEGLLLQYPDNLAAQQNLEEARHHLAQLREQAKQLQTAGLDAAGQLELAVLLDKMGQREQARSLAATVAEETKAQLLIASIDCRIGKFERAIPFLRRLYESKPAEALPLLVIAHGGAGRLAEARRFFAEMEKRELSASLDHRYFARLAPFDSSD